MRGPHTHCVWWRYRGLSVTAWNSRPLLYRSERAATMAAKDRNKLYVFRNGRIEHVVTKMGEKPKD